MRAAPMAVTQHPVRARATLARTLSTGRALCGWLALASLLAPLIGLVLCACTAGVTIAPPSPASPCTRTPACAPQAAMASRRENARTLSRRDYDLAPPSRIATSYLLDIVSEAQRERNLLHESSHANDLADTPEEHEREPGYAGHQASGSRGAHAGAHAVDGGGAGAGSQENAERPAARRCSTVGSPSIRPSRTSSAGIEAGVKVPQRTMAVSRPTLPRAGSAGNLFSLTRQNSETGSVGEAERERDAVKSKDFLAMLVQDDLPTREDVVMRGQLYKRVAGRADWIEQTVCLTSSALAYGDSDTNKAVDTIHLSDVCHAAHLEESQYEADLQDVYFEIQCTEDSELGSRLLQFRAGTPEQAACWVHSINKEVKRFNDGQLSAQERIRQHLQRLYWAQPTQIFCVALILGSFACDVAENEIRPAPGSKSQKTFDGLDMFFNVVFILELLLNMAAHWFLEFWKNSWNILDFCIVMTSVISMIFSGLPGVKVLRVFRAFRIVRVFKRLDALRIICTSMVRSFKPVVNAFGVLMMATAVYAIVGTQMFSSEESELFGNFSRSFFTMFQCMTADGWATDVARPMFYKEGSDYHPGVAFFFVSYMLLVFLVLVNIVLAVLLDEFLKAADEEKRSMSASVNHKQGQEATALDPFLEQLSHFFTSVELEKYIQTTFKFLDSNDDKKLSFAEIAEGFRMLKLKPRINLTEEDINAMTRGGQICSEFGVLTAKEFEHMLRSELLSYVQRQATNQLQMQGRDPKKGKYDGTDTYLLRYQITALDELRNMIMDFMKSDASDRWGARSDSYSLPTSETGFHPRSQWADKAPYKSISLDPPRVEAPTMSEFKLREGFSSGVGAGGRGARSEGPLEQHQQGLAVLRSRVNELESGHGQVRQQLERIESKIDELVSASRTAPVGTASASAAAAAAAAMEYQAQVPVLAQSLAERLLPLLAYASARPGGADVSSGTPGGAAGGRGGEGDMVQQAGEASTPVTIATSRQLDPINTVPTRSSTAANRERIGTIREGAGSHGAGSADSPSEVQALVERYRKLDRSASSEAEINSGGLVGSGAATRSWRDSPAEKNRRLHELEMMMRRLSNDNDQLQQKVDALENPPYGKG